MSEMRVMDPKQGDFRVRWDPNDPGSVENARQQFNDLMGPGERRSFRAYRVSSSTGRRQGEPITEFDPSATELLVVPQMAGGRG